jgi:chromate transporter
MKQQTVSLWFLFWTFLKIGSTAFGGFMALISIVQTIIVERHKLMTEKEMLDGISLATLLPGPVAVNVVTYVGYSLRGAKGAFISTVGVLLPSFLLVLSVAIVYLKWQKLLLLPLQNHVFYSQ